MEEGRSVRKTHIANKDFLKGAHNIWTKANTNYNNRHAIAEIHVKLILPSCFVIIYYILSCQIISYLTVKDNKFFLFFITEHTKNTICVKNQIRPDTSLLLIKKIVLPTNTH